MPKPITFRLLVLGAIDLLPLGKSSEHKKLGLELKPAAPSREEYFKEGTFRVSPELQVFLRSANFGGYNGIIICHHNSWGIEVMSGLPSNLGAKLLVVDRDQEPTGYPAGSTLGIYSNCWEWIKTRVIFMQAMADSTSG